MYKCRWNIITVCIILFSLQKSFGQFTPTPPLPGEINAKIQNDSNCIFRISGIAVTGNKKTKTYIILREMEMSKDSTVAGRELFLKIDRSRKLIYNTTLFNSVEIYPEQDSDTSIYLTVTVAERWYIFPMPQFQLADRNFNEWIKEHNGNLNRVIYGGKFTHYNVSGRRDQLRAMLLFGYTRNISVAYVAPYSNKKLTEGFGAIASYTQNREIPYKTTKNNKLAFVKSNYFLKKEYKVGGSYMRREGHYRTHIFSAAFTFSDVNDSIVSSKYNPNYYNSKKSYQNYPEFGYRLQYLNVDNVRYPLSGYSGYWGITKRGLLWNGGMNALILDGAINSYKQLGKGWYGSVNLTGKLVAPFENSYLNQRAMGYFEYYLRGLEYYVIDGPLSGVSALTLKKHLFSFKINNPLKWETLPNAPFAIYAKVFSDGGYVHQNAALRTNLNNKFLYTWGAGLDIVSIYDSRLRIEYSFNQLKEKGLFLHTLVSF